MRFKIPLQSGFQIIHSNLIYLNYLFQVCNVFLDSSSCIYEGKQKPLLKQLEQTRSEIALIGTDLVLDFLSDNKIM